MGYSKKIQITNQDDYIFSDTIPYNPDFDLQQLEIIQNKILNYTSANSCNGLTPQEAEIFLDWVTFNARNYAVKDIPESPLTSSMSGQCAPTQRINVKLLRRFGLDARPFNTSDCIGEIPLNESDKKRVQNGWASPAVSHSVSIVSLPIMNETGITQLHNVLLDPTCRQFFLKTNCAPEKFADPNWLSHGYVAPHPGYFMQADNLMHLGISWDTAQKTEALGKQLIHKGYCFLTEENAKLYGDTFVRASKRIEFQNQPIHMSGKEYIKNFENIPMQLLDFDPNDHLFTKLPSEIAAPKPNIFTKIGAFFKNLITPKTQMLPAGNSSNTATYSHHIEIPSVTLTPADKKCIQRKTAEIAKTHSQNSTSQTPIIPTHNHVNTRKIIYYKRWLNAIFIFIFYFC